MLSTPKPGDYVQWGSPTVTGHVEDAWFPDLTPAFALVMEKNVIVTQRALLMHVSVPCPDVPDNAERDGCKCV